VEEFYFYSSKNYSADTGEEAKKGKINFRPGIEPGTQRLGVQYTRHQAITQDKSMSPHSPHEHVDRSEKLLHKQHQFPSSTALY